MAEPMWHSLTAIREIVAYMRDSCRSIAAELDGLLAELDASPDLAAGQFQNVELVGRIVATMEKVGAALFSNFPGGPTELANRLRQHGQSPN